ncbi:MAG: NlpC/P60 family protein [Prosthecobacter sp.]
MILRALSGLLALSTVLHAQNGYQSPCSVTFSFPEEELIGDLLKGPRSDWKEHASVSYRDWYNALNHKRWGYWGPAMKHFSAPSGLAKQSPQWSRERVIATGLRYAGYSYQHHHVPDWEPPADWPRDPEQKTAVGKGVDCSNFTAFVYNLALGIKPTGAVKDQSQMTEVEGPGAGRRVPVRRIELSASYEDYPKVLKTGDLLFVKSMRGNVSHVVLWVGKIGQSPDGLPLILDSTGTGAKDANGEAIPDGIQLRPFRRTAWYFTQASHVLRIIPEDE